MATTETPWCGSSTNQKLYLQSGQFSATMKDSEDVSAVDGQPGGIEWDGTNSAWAGDGDNKYYLQSGKFSATIKTSIASGRTGDTGGVSWDGTNSPISDSADTQATDISDTGGNTAWSGSSGNETMYLQSGQFSATVKASLNVQAIESIFRAMSWDGVNTPWGGISNDKLYLQSGQFSVTMKTSLDVSGVNQQTQGISTDDNNARLGGSAAFTPRIISF